MKLVFKKSGKIAWFNAIGGGTTVSSNGGELTGELKVEDGRVIGEAKLPTEGDGALKRSFDVRFNVALGLDQAAKPAARPAGPVKPTVTGTFKGNGKPAKLAFVSAYPGEPFADKPSITLVFTEKDHSKEKKPDFKAGFGEFGSALILSLHEDGKIFGCEVSHSAHEQRPFSSVGSINTGEFEVGEGFVSGQITTDGEQKVFGNTWEVDIKFEAPYVAPAAPKPVAVAEESKSKKSKKAKKKTDEEPAEEKPESDKPAEPTGDVINVYELALPKDASDFEYRTLVEQMLFSSAGQVPAVAKEFTDNLAKQGWEIDGRDLVTSKSAILKRTRGEASLTIFVKPADKGSRITIMSEGLDWEKKAEKEEEKKEEE